MASYPLQFPEAVKALEAKGMKFAWMYKPAAGALVPGYEYVTRKTEGIDLPEGLYTEHGFVEIAELRLAVKSATLPKDPQEVSDASEE